MRVLSAHNPDVAKREHYKKRVLARANPELAVDGGSDGKQLARSESKSGSGCDGCGKSKPQNPRDKKS
jgi:hypothetical protein